MDYFFPFRMKWMLRHRKLLPTEKIIHFSGFCQHWSPPENRVEKARNGGKLTFKNPRRRLSPREWRATGWLKSLIRGRRVGGIEVISYFVPDSYLASFSKCILSWVAPWGLGAHRRRLRNITRWILWCMPYCRMHAYEAMQGVSPCLQSHLQDLHIQGMIRGHS